MLRERVAPQSEVIRVIVWEDSRCGVPHRGAGGQGLAAAEDELEVSDREACDQIEGEPSLAVVDRDLLGRDHEHALRCRSPRWLGPFDAQGAPCTTIRGDWGHLV